MPSGALEFPDISRVYARFAALTALLTGFGGALLLYAGLDSEGFAIAMASNIAGVASLGLESDGEKAKAALRSGVCDFVVNDLGEALRVLKNEIRQRRGVSVVLTAECDGAVAEIVERGVQPDVLAFPVPELMERGARLLPAEVADARIPVSWSVAREAPRWLHAIDALATSSLPSGDVRLRWLESASRYLGRAYAGQRFLRMSGTEADAFIGAVRDAVQSGSIAAPVAVERGGEMARIT